MNDDSLKKLDEISNSISACEKELFEHQRDMAEWVEGVTKAICLMTANVLELRREQKDILRKPLEETWKL